MNASVHDLVIAGKTYHSRLLVGTGKYKDFAETRAAIDASGAEIVTVAIRRVNIGQNPGEPNLLDALPPSQFTILPNQLRDILSESTTEKSLVPCTPARVDSPRLLVFAALASEPPPN